MKLNYLETFFKTVDNWPESIKLDICSRTINPKQTTETHIEILKGNPGKERFRPYYNRLITIYKALKPKQESNIELFLELSK